MWNPLSKLLDANAREVNRLSDLVTKKINPLESSIQKLTDDKLLKKSQELKKRHQEKGESLDSLLPEMFALVREAGLRHLNQRHFDVQMVSGIVLHEGKISEQKTGEGKTHSAVLALALNALSGEGVHLVTVNDYLAKRDAGWNGPIFHALGLSVSTIIHNQAFLYDPKFSDKNADDKRLKHLRPISRKEAYAVDITYGTNNEFGFDYLRDNGMLSLQDQVQRGHHFAIVDEVDSVLIDEARTPLIISAPSLEPTDKYPKFTKIVDQLSADTDFVIDEKSRTANFTDHGIIKIEKMLNVENLYEKDFGTLHHLEEALRARTLMQRDKEYVVKDGEIIIVDENTGRLMPGRRFSEGLHQAIEAKENVPIQQESKTLATISLQNYFRMYEKLAGMTGTAATEAEEFHKIYKLNVVIVPTHQEMVRKDHSDSIYKTVSAKYSAVAEEVERIHETGQPVLVGTTSIEKNEFLSDLLARKKISHALLNAKNHEKEAEIISGAGQKGAVTVATNMAGRGVDIKLGKDIDRLGGLYVIGTERHESRRIDNQLRGRSGRQGDPGASKFFVSLEDDLMRIFGGDQVAKIMTMLKVPEDMPIENPLVSRALEGAQKKVEGHNFDMRKHTLEYDDVMNQQRKIIYGVRQQILVAMAGSEDDQNELKEQIINKIETEIDQIVLLNTAEEILFEKIIDEFNTIIPHDSASHKALVSQIENLGDSEKISEFLKNLAKAAYESREKDIKVEAARFIESQVYLSTIDQLWIEHLDTVDDLRSGIDLRRYAQRDPLIEYKREAFDLFETLIKNIDSEIVHRIYRVNIPQQRMVSVAQGQELHQEALDQSLLVQEVEREEETSLDSPKVKIERMDEEVVAENRGTTKVIIERNGQVETQSLGDGGQLLRSHGKLGRNDPCYCGSGKKYKKCHYPN